MTFTILIIGSKQKTQLQRASDIHTRIVGAGTIDEAERCIETEPVDMILFALNDEGRDAFLLARMAMEKHPSIKSLFFSDQESLQGTLATLVAMPASQLKALFSGGNEPVAAAMPKVAPTVSALPRIDGHDAGRFNYDRFIGDSPEIHKIKNLIVKIAPTNATILLQGESGTGKEVIARSVHVHSIRKNEAFVPVDCAAINESVIESELFGHTKGAFTGADRDTIGLIRSADKGTLFLDEIAELPMALQVKLLRTLQERVVKPVGSAKTYPVDIRIIAATNCNLAEAVKTGTFRQDLYYRLNVITIWSPPLCEHVADIPMLCRYFIGKLVQDGFPEKQFSESAMQALKGYDWPGNIRELENVVRRGVILSHGDLIESSDLPISPTLSEEMESSLHLDPSSMASHEKEAIRKALEQMTGNRRAAAQLLGISEATLYRRIKLYGM